LWLRARADKPPMAPGTILECVGIKMPFSRATRRHTPLVPTPRRAEVILLASMLSGQLGQIRPSEGRRLYSHSTHAKLRRRRAIVRRDSGLSQNRYMRTPGNVVARRRDGRRLMNAAFAWDNKANRPRRAGPAPRTAAWHERTGHLTWRRAKTLCADPRGGLKRHIAQKKCPS
jgi:hypothetical protein